MWTTAVKHLPVTTIDFNIHNSIIFYNLKNLYQHFKCYWQLQFRKIRYSYADDSITLVCLIIVCSRISPPISVQTVINVLLCSRPFRIQRVRFLVFATLHCNYMESPKIKLVPNLIWHRKIVCMGFHQHFSPLYFWCFYYVARFFPL